METSMLVEAGKNTILDLRKYPRLSAEDWIFAILESHQSGLAKIIDVSQGGLAFQYVAHPNRPPLAKDAVIRMALFEARSHRFLLRVDCRAVYDAETPEEDVQEKLKIRRCGARFVRFAPYSVRSTKMFN